MTNAPGGLLAVWMEPPPESEEDFNRWYDEEHLADRISLPGVFQSQALPVPARRAELPRSLRTCR
jgi:hypothetical protein